MAIAGSSINCVKVRLEDGKPIFGGSQRAAKELVVEDVVEAATRIRAGETVYLELFGYNRMMLEFVIDNNLYPHPATQAAA